MRKREREGYNKKKKKVPKKVEWCKKERIRKREREKIHDSMTK